MSTLAAKAFIDKGPPYVGNCRFQDKDRCKELGARWDKDSKKWKAVDEKTLLALCKSGKWCPLGFTSHMTNTVSQLIVDRERESEKKALEVVKANAAKQASRAKYSADKDMMVPPDEEEDLKEVAAFGITPGMVASSGPWADLGPRSGISSVRRLKRAVGFGIVSWEQVTAGRTDYEAKSSSRKTGARGEGWKGVKRVVQQVQRRGDTRQVEKKQKVDAPQETSKPRPSTPTPAKPKLPVPHYTYTASCSECGTDLDSSKQFGMECMCADGFVWSACKRCLVPIRKPEPCKKCVYEIKAWMKS
jgi:hypothetical protein